MTPVKNMLRPCVCRSRENGVGKENGLYRRRTTRKVYDEKVVRIEVGRTLVSKCGLYKGGRGTLRKDNIGVIRV